MKKPAGLPSAGGQHLQELEDHTGTSPWRPGEWVCLKKEVLVEGEKPEEAPREVFAPHNMWGPPYGWQGHCEQEQRFGGWKEL